MQHQLDEINGAICEKKTFAVEANMSELETYRMR